MNLISDRSTNTEVLHISVVVMMQIHIYEVLSPNLAWDTAYDGFPHSFQENCQDRTG
jgi:hypothetical protein